MRLLKQILPYISTAKGVEPDILRHQFNYRRIWKVAVLLTGGVSLIPLIFITLLNYESMQHAVESEILFRTTRLVSNTRRAVSFFLTERKFALDYIVHDNRFEALSDRDRLSSILENLTTSFGGGFVDLGVIDSSGKQINYAGPYRLEGMDYSNQEWFRQVMDQGVHISDVFLGYRRVPHLVIAVRGRTQEGAPYVLRAALGIGPFENLLSNLELPGLGDAFMINHRGVLQTPSRYHGNVLEALMLPVPPYSESTEVFTLTSPTGEGDRIVGYRYIDESPFILMVVKRKEECMKPWIRTRWELMAFLIVSVSVILTVILGTATYMVKKIQIADEKRLHSLHQAEYANKMASIGRIAASVAHEINNPLAIINEKAGLLQDLFLMKEQYAKDDKLLGLAGSIISSVKRAGTITKRLLNFARNLQASVETVHLEEVIREVLGFTGKEAEHRGIEITVDVPKDLHPFESDRGKLQQIFLNIINNAFGAVQDGGHIDIRVERETNGFVSVAFADDGCGIPKEHQGRIFEPFYSTKRGQEGTGLGLSITYNLVQEIGGRIQVESEVGKGTRFTITIPLDREAQ